MDTFDPTSMPILIAAVVFILREVFQFITDFRDNPPEEPIDPGVVTLIQTVKTDTLDIKEVLQEKDEEGVPKIYRRASHDRAMERIAKAIEQQTILLESVTQMLSEEHRRHE